LAVSATNREIVTCCSEAQRSVELGVQGGAAVAGVAAGAGADDLIGHAEDVERVHNVGAAVAELELVATVDGDRRRVGERPVTAGEGGDGAVGIDPAESGVACVGDEQVARRVEPDAVRRVQLRVAHELLADFGMEAFAERARVEPPPIGELARKPTADTLDQLTPQRCADPPPKGEGVPTENARLLRPIGSYARSFSLSQRPP
jgi:hypothetical protein